MNDAPEGSAGSVILFAVIVVAFFFFSWRKKNAASRLPEVGGRIPNGWREHGLSLAVVIIGITLAIWSHYTSLKVADVGRWSANFMVPLLFLWGTLAALVALNAKERGPVLQWVLGVVFVSLFLIGWIAGEKPRTAQEEVRATATRVPGDCTYTRPCAPVPHELAGVPTGKVVCFDPPLGADPEKFGYRYVTPQGVERQAVCTPDGLVQGTCREEPANAFRFVKTGNLPRYWFAAPHGGVCQ